MPMITISENEHYYIMPNWTKKRKQASIFAVNIDGNNGTYFVFHYG